MRVCSSVVERYSYKVDVHGSNPCTPTPPMNEEQQKKYQELIEKKQRYEEKLKYLYKNFRGVIHEDSSSEIKYTQIKVYESFIISIEDELRAMEAAAGIDSSKR